MKNQDFIKQIRNMSTAELEKKLWEVKSEREGARLKKVVGKLKNSSLPQVLSKQVAQIKTILREKQLSKAAIQSKPKPHPKGDQPLAEK